MRTNLLRDLAALPPAIRTGIQSYPPDRRRRAGRRLAASITMRRAAIGHGVAFQTWQSLAHQGLNDAEATKLIIGLISTAQ